MPKITFMPSGVTIEVQTGTTVFSAAAEAEVAIPSQCGGKCACALCRVKIAEGAHLLSPMRWEEEGHLGNAFFVTRERLSCQLQVWGDITVEVPDAPVKEKQRGRYIPYSIIRKREKLEKEAEMQAVRDEGRRAKSAGGAPGPRRSGPADGRPGPPRGKRAGAGGKREDSPPSTDAPQEPRRRRRRRRRKPGGVRPGDSRPPSGADKPEN